MVVLNPKEFEIFWHDLRERNYKVVAVSGYFDPPTPAHLKYFKAAKSLGDLLIVILNTDEQLLQKRQGTKLGGKIRYSFLDRAEIINEFKSVDCVVKSVDTAKSIAVTLKLVKPRIFAKGGDRTIENIPREEIEVCKEIGCEIVCGVGGEKTHSSSWYDWEDGQY
jgi:D-beta-D-heptose 7-phosphate kinase/D-beta-D-heptose 1-phosphate adenosyltransferase